jgi:hypothetical protein
LHRATLASPAWSRDRKPLAKEELISKIGGELPAFGVTPRIAGGLAGLCALARLLRPAPRRLSSRSRS